MDSLVPLHLLPTGHFGRVNGIVGHTDDVHRLREFGFRDGAEVHMFRSGDPCIVQLAGNKVCVRVDDQLYVMVKPHPSPC